MGGFMMRIWGRAKKQTKINYRGTGCADLATAGVLKLQYPRAKDQGFELTKCVPVISQQRFSNLT
jgi:hypothetical protein